MNKKGIINGLQRLGLLCGLLSYGVMQSAGAAEYQKVLPGNAIVHAEIESLLGVVSQLENFLKSGVPEELAPPDVRGLLEQEHPALTLLGMKMMGKPLEPEILSRHLGIDPDAPVSFTLYPGDPRRFFILGLGLTSAEHFLGAATSPDGPVKASKVSIGGLDMLQVPIQGRGPQALYGLVHGDRVYVSCESSLLLLLDDTEGYERLNGDAHMADVFERTDELDLFLTIHPNLIKPLYKQAGFFKYFPVSLLSLKKEEFLSEIPEREREMIDMQIRMQMPVSGLDELLNYGECAVTAIYHTAFDALLSEANSFEGLTFGIRARSETPGLVFMVHGSEDRAGQMTAPIAMDELKSALVHFPGELNQWSAVGQKPSAVPSKWVTRTLDRMHELMAAKELNTDWLDKLREVHVEQKLVQPLESGARWTLKAGTQINRLPKPDAFDSMEMYFTGVMEHQYEPTFTTVTVVPGQGPDYLKAHLKQKKLALQSIDEDTLSLLPPRQQQRWIDQLYRYDSTQLDNGVTRLTWENVWKTRSGLFGFSEHELVNRKTYAARQVEDFLVFHKSNQDSSWLEEFHWHDEGELGRSQAALLDLVPEGANRIGFVKLNGVLPAAVHGLADLEDLAHREIHQYLDKVRSVIEDLDQDDKSSLQKAVTSIQMPASLAGVNINRENGEIYGVLPGNLSFPRPKVLPVLEELIADYEKDSHDVGGLITYTRHDKGTCEYGIMHHTGALTSFLRKTGNTVARLYLKDPQGMQKLMGQVMSPLDMRSDDVKAGDIIARNPRWAFLDQIRVGPQAQVTRAYDGPKIDAAPQHPIPVRAADISEKCIDLTSHYNAALNDEFHKGGQPFNTLENFPVGTHVVEGIQFDARGLIHLNGAQVQIGSMIQYPENIDGISIGQKADRIHFLHGTGWPTEEGMTVAHISVHYEDGTTARIPVRYGIDTLDWWTAPNTSVPENSVVAWEGENESTANSDMFLRLYATSWDNPHPGKLIAALGLESTMTDSSPYLLAVTLE